MQLLKKFVHFLEYKMVELLIGVEDESPYNPTNTLEQDLEQFSKDNTIGYLESHMKSNIRKQSHL